MIVVENLSKSFQDISVLRDWSGSFPDGAVSCIMGESGCGKTTLLRILMGLESCDSGCILGLEGKRKSAVFPEHRLCENLSPLSNLKLVCGSHRSRQELVQDLEATGLEDCFQKPVRELSDGMCRRVSIVRALEIPFDVLFLDEPFRGLDAYSRLLTIDLMKRRTVGKTVIMVTHNPEEPALMEAVQTIALKK